VILFDEIEKAHPDVFNVLLQLLDDGRLTDGQGRVVDFTNSVIIMTSNLGSDVIMSFAEKKKKDSAVLDAVFSPEGEVQKILRACFRPEFLNRIDDIIVFDALTREQIAQIVDLQVARVARRLEQQGITLDVSKAAAEYLAQKGYDPAYGARPLKRLIQNEILDELSLQIIEGKVQDGDTVSIGVKDGKVSFKKK